MANKKVAVVYSCCSVGHEGYTTELCWACGEGKGRDAWSDTDPYDYDGLAVRRSIELTGKPKGTSSL